MGKDKKIIISEVWKYNKKTKIATKLVALLIDGKPFKIFDGYLIENKIVDKKWFENKFKN